MTVAPFNIEYDDILFHFIDVAMQRQRNSFPLLMLCSVGGFASQRSMW